MAPISHLIFDLDQTLVDSQRAYDLGLRALQIDPQGKPFLQARAAVKNRLGLGTPAARNRLLYFKQMLLDAGHYSHSRLMDWMRTYEQVVADELARQWQQLNRDALFRQLQSRFRLAIVTNENLRMQTLKLQAVDPQGTLFPIVVTSEEENVEKPHRKIFESALRQLNVAPELCLFVGDSLEMDIRPAMALGMATRLSLEFQVLDPVPSDVVTIACLDELEQLP